jgi:hypothetical protein
MELMRLTTLAYQAMIMVRAPGPSALARSAMLSGCMHFAGRFHHGTMECGKRGVTTLFSPIK